MHAHTLYIALQSIYIWLYTIWLCGHFFCACLHVTIERPSLGKPHSALSPHTCVFQPFGLVVFSTYLIWYRSKIATLLGHYIWWYRDKLELSLPIASMKTTWLGERPVYCVIFSLFSQITLAYPKCSHMYGQFFTWRKDTCLLKNLWLIICLMYVMILKNHLI